MKLGAWCAVATHWQRNLWPELQSPYSSWAPVLFSPCLGHSATCSACGCTHTRTHINLHTSMQTHVHAHTQMCTCTHPHMHTHRYTCKPVPIHRHKHACVYIQTCTHLARQFGGGCWIPIRNPGIYRKAFAYPTLCVTSVGQD